MRSSSVCAVKTCGSETIWIDPAQIKFKISPVHDLHGTVGGDWDRERVHPLAIAVKHRSIAQRYRGGVPWEKTDLFAVYARRLATGESVRGARTLQELAEQYRTRVDGLFESMKAHGFQLCAGRRVHPLPMLLLGRDQIFIGNQGNHRLAMAQILGLREFAGRVTCRHPLAAMDGQVASPHESAHRSPG